MILFINTASTEKILLALKFKRRTHKAEFKPKFNQTENLLAEIDRLFTRFRKLPQDLKGIVAVIGPGPYTALRVGITVANTLSFALNTSIIGLKTNEVSSIDDFIKIGEQKLLKNRLREFLIPYYGRKPNITKPKKRASLF